MFQRALALALTLLLVAAPMLAAQNQLGVVTQSNNGHLNSASASAGATLYIGDRLGTDSNGTMALRSGTVQMVLSEDSVLFMNGDASGLIPRLDRGTVAFHVEGNENFRVTAADVTVRAQLPVPTSGQVTLEKCDVLVTARVSSLEVTAGSETKTLEEGKTYRVELRGACAADQNHGPRFPATSRFWMVSIPILVGTCIAVCKGFESPDRP